MHTIQDLRVKQALPLDIKVNMTKQRIREWVDHYGIDGVYVSFSGGKDSTVLLHIARQIYPDMKACFVDTGLEYPEIRQFVKTWDNVDWIRPKMTFKQVIEKYGYPFISKEVSECVQGARKYLRSLIADGTIITDRQTDRQTDGISTPTDIISCVEQANLAVKIGGGRHPFQYECDRLLGTYRLHAAENQGGGTITSIANYEELVATLKRKMINREGGSNERALILLGELPPKTKKKELTPDKSRFSQEKYKFFLEAPFEISNKCCNVMKKAPAHDYGKRTGRKPILATMAEESQLRTQKWLQNGCNGFNMKSPVSTPMAFWTNQDILKYIKDNGIEICKVYGDIVPDYCGEQLEGQMDFCDLGLAEDNRKLKTTGCDRTGCMFCGFGCHLEKEGEGRFELMKKTHPKQYDYIMRPKEQGGLNFKEVIDWINEHGNLNIKY